MIVDDDRTTVRLLQTLLELDGFDVSVAPRGGDALPLALQVQPDIILMDYHLSDMNGTQVIRRLRADPTFASTPIIMVSGMDVEREAMKAGATTFLVKPFEPDLLPELFDSLMQQQ